MQCPVCKNGKLDLLRIVEVKDKVLRLKRCMSCKRGFISEELMFETTSEIGAGLKKELYAAIYTEQKAKGLFPPKGNPKQTKPKEKRKVAPKPSERIEGEVYLTYGDLFEKFRKAWHPEWEINDMRPYPLLEHSIIVWFSSGEEKAYQYHPDSDVFISIPDAKTYEEILEDAWGKKP